MRHAAFTLLFCVLLTASVGDALAAVDSAPIKAIVTEKDKPAAAPIHIAIVPHRAAYEMSLGSVKNGSNVASVTGHMIFEWGDVCDGWAVQQHLNLHFNYAEGTESNINSTELTWEAKDGKSYNFNIHRVTDNKDTENFRGKATLDDKGGSVVYTTPEGKLAKLPADAVFPSAHTQMILQKAAANERFFTRRVFDGTDDDGSNDVSVFIDAPQAHWLETELDPKLKENPLLNQVAWPVRMAFFKVDTETGEPDYEMDLSLLANGIARSMRIDYGDFSVIGTLTAVEPLPVPHC